jgi:hypothetical protein
MDGKIKSATKERPLRYGIGICGKCFKEFERKVKSQRYKGTLALDRKQWQGVYTTKYLIRPIDISRHIFNVI